MFKRFVAFVKRVFAHLHKVPVAPAPVAPKPPVSNPIPPTGA